MVSNHFFLLLSFFSFFFLASVTTVIGICNWCIALWINRSILMISSHIYLSTFSYFFYSLLPPLSKECIESLLTEVKTSIVIIESSQKLLYIISTLIRLEIRGITVVRTYVNFLHVLIVFQKVPNFSDDKKNRSQLIRLA